MKGFIVCCYIYFMNLNGIFKDNINIKYWRFFLGTYGPTSPCVQRGRFAVIPEEPSSSPSVNDATTNRRTPSPDWDFTIEVT